MEQNIRWGKGTRVHDADRGREILLEAAIKCITRDGTKLTTMQSIASEAQVSRRTVHRYFRTKHELINEVTMYLEERIFQNIEQNASRYADDFFTYLEEAIVLGVNGLTMLEDLKDKVIANDAANDADSRQEIATNTFFDAQLTRWMQLLRKPYRNESTKRNQRIASLEAYAKLAMLLVTGHYQLQSKEKHIRESFKNMIFISQRQERSMQHDRYDIPLANNAIDKPKGKRVKSLFL